VSLPPLQDLLDLFPDNTVGAIMPIDIRSQTETFYEAIAANTENFNLYLPLQGGTLQGALVLAGEPVNPLEAASKSYVDAFISGANLVQKNGDTMLGVLRAYSATPPENLSLTPKVYVDQSLGQLAVVIGQQTILTDGSNNMDSGYVPVNDKGVATKEYVDNAGSVPSGTILPYMGIGSVPFGYLICDGSTVLRANYPQLYSAIGDAYGSNDGVTNFVLPDLRGQFLRFTDNGAGVDPDSLTRTDRGDGTTGDAVGTKQGDAIRNIAGSFDINRANGGDVGVRNGIGIVDVGDDTGLNSPIIWQKQSDGNTDSRVSFDASLQVPTANDNRPTNIYATAMIKV